MGIVLRIDLQTPGGLIILNLESKARVSRDGRYNTLRTPLTQELRMIINNMARTNAGTNVDIDIVDAKGKALTNAETYNNTSTSPNIKSAHIQYPIEREDEVISNKNLSRDNNLKIQLIE